MLLTAFRHIRNIDRTAHEGGPRLLCERLRGDELPELPLSHDDFGYAVVQNPVLQRGEASLLAIGEHRIGNGFSHGPVPWFVRVLLPLAPSRATPAVARQERRSHSRRKGLRK